MIARVTRLSTAGVNMAYPADAALVGRHDISYVLLSVMLASLLSRNLQIYHASTENVLTPWQAGKNAIWNLTVTDTLAMPYLNSTQVTTGSIAEQVSARKEEKYAALTLSHTFYPNCCINNGSNKFKSIIFLQELGHHLLVTTGNPLESAFLFQRLSVALLRYNAVCIIRDTFGVVQDNDSG